MKKLRWLKSYQGSSIGEEFNAGEKSAENFVSQGFAEYVTEPIQLSKETISKLISKEVEQIKKEPQFQELEKENKEAEERNDKRLGINSEKKEPKKLNPEMVGEYIKAWASEGFTPFTIASIKQVAELSDFTVTELKQFVKDELKQKEIIARKQEEEKPIKPKSNNIKLQYLDLARDKNWGDATELLVNWILKENYIYTTKDDQKSEVWIYKEGIYVPQGKSQIRENLRKLLGKYYSDWIFGKVMEKIEPDTFIDADKFFSYSYIQEVPILNGILNVFTRELKPFDPKKIFFNKLPVEYNPILECPQIEKFLGDVLSKEDDKLVFYELGGFCLLKEYKFEKAFMFVGNGRNGKDKVLELIKRLVGIENCCSVPLAAIIPDSFIISEFHNRMVNLSGEISNQDLKETMTFKSLTGRSLQSAPRKFLKPVHFVNHAKFIFACNELPMVYDNSKGFWDRWVLLEFPFTFLPQEDIDKAEDKSTLKLRDVDIIDKITTKNELSGLLNKFLEGLDRLINNKRFSSTQGSEEIKQLWIRKSNSCMAFCLNEVQDFYDSYITKKEFRKKYSEFCKKHKIVARSDYVIKRTLEELFGASEENKEIFGKWDKVWGGIQWKK